MTQRCRANASRNIGLSATVSALALKLAGSCFRGFFHQWNEPPAHRDELDPAGGCGSHDFYRVGRGDVVVGLQIASRTVREFVQILDFIPRVALDKSPAHADILAFTKSPAAPPP